MADAGEELALGVIGSFGFLFARLSPSACSRAFSVCFSRGDVANDTQEALGGALPNFGDQEEFTVQVVAGLALNPRFVAGKRFALPGELVIASPVRGRRDRIRPSTGARPNRRSTSQ